MKSSTFKPTVVACTWQAPDKNLDFSNDVGVYSDLLLRVCPAASPSNTSSVNSDNLP